MKPVIIIDQGEMLGGAERYVLDIVSALPTSDRNRLSVQIWGGQIASYKRKIPTWATHKPLKLPSFKGNAIKKLIAGLSLFSAGRKVGKALKKVQPRSVVTNTPRAHFVVLMAWWLGFWRGKWCVIVHDFHTEKKFWAGIEKWLRRHIFDRSQVIIAVSVITRNKVREYLSSDQYSKIRIVENGLSVHTLPAPQVTQGIDKVLMLGRIDPRKGQLVFANAMELLKDTEMNGFIAGSSTNKDAATVKYEAAVRAVMDLKKLKNLHLLGEVENPFDLIAEADVMLILPMEPETFGRVVIEALVMGTLPIVADEAGPREIIQQYAQYIGVDPSVFLLSDRTPKAIAEKLEQAKSLSKEELAFLLEPGRPFVEKYYSLHETTKRFVNAVD